ncbi:MAG: PKD domain-containing protein [Thermoanaerobaculaceae bacterium]
MRVPGSPWAAGDFAIRLPCTALTVKPTSLPAAEAGRPYSASLTVSGGRGPYRAWVVAGRLPSGLSLPAAGTSITGTPAELGTFSATVRVADGRHCTSDAQLTITVGLPATCSVACSADVPVSAEVGEPVTMAGSGAAFSCAGGATYDWDFGDGSPHAGTASVEHSYASAGNYQWRLTVTASGVSCSTSGSITVVQGVTYRYLIPSVAHLPGAGGTVWRTDVAAVNTAPDRATLTLSYHGPTSLGRTATLTGRGAVEHVNILESLFGMSPASQSSGSLEIASNRPLAISSRTYNQTPSGTYGQAYPALAESDALAPGQAGVLPQLKRSNSFRTNVGIANPGPTPVTVLITLLGATGAQVGSSRTLTAAPGGWAQQYDIFSAAGAGMQAVACATVEVSGGRAWAYASLIDSATGDPTTIPIQPLRVSGLATRYFVPSVAHLPGAGGTLWRTDLGLANRTAQKASLALTFRSSGNPLVLTRELAAHSAAEWGNVVESVLGLPPSSRTSGCLEVAATVPLALASRTYNQTESGTFGQLYPAITAADSLQPGQVGLLPQLRKNASFRTNVGFVNLGDARVEVAFTLFDSNGSRLGSTKVMSAEPGAWVQQYDLFAAVGAGNRDVAYATVEVLTADGRAWAYASVVDAATGDPTTITVLVP